MPLRERVALLISTIPIALISNILRITATAWAYHLLGAKQGEKIAHDTAGWAMMPIALALCWVELKILSWLIIEDEAAPQGLYLPPTATRAAPKKGGKSGGHGSGDENSPALFFPSTEPRSVTKKAPKPGDVPGPAADL
jgi:exosortase/archaeosortase family protein